MSFLLGAENKIRFWISISLVNLALVAFLGLVLRSKILFSIPFLDFKHILHAHSHFAFGGWVALALLALLTHYLLPAGLRTAKIFRYTIAGTLVTAYGMLAGFIWQGYAFLSILFSTLFILVSYVFAFVFIREIRRAALSRQVKMLAASAVLYMVLSSVGPFTLAYLMATRSQNLYLYKDAIYTYLHLQYNGFFTLSVFALLLHYLDLQGTAIRWFGRLLNASVLPSLFLSYLWHYPGTFTAAMAIAGSVLTAACLVCFLYALPLLQTAAARVYRPAKTIASIALTAFALKMLFQAVLIIPSLGERVFSNRPVIIGFLHLVLLGFVSVFLLAYFIERGLLSYKKAAVAVWTFIIGIVLNELVLFTQGLGFMLLFSSSAINWLLLAAACCLFAGAALIAYRCMTRPFWLQTGSSVDNNRIFSFNNKIN
ncbi:hypothetical protein [Sediminibacterium soli]|uniref:hypothetical protein n=1 Tax=Sediminibacterium soli TaxID=2698829 RepID=UPI00137B070E|nr:hypothetical protein [Sediminibacterium soli]NCI46278.1 hypothetical protein [Sediminibacterium soli]